MKNARRISDLLQHAVVAAQAKRDVIVRDRLRKSDEIENAAINLAGETRVADLGDEIELRALARFAARKSRELISLRGALEALEAEDRARLEAIKAAFARRKTFDIYLERQAARKALRDREKGRQI